MTGMRGAEEAEIKKLETSAAKIERILADITINGDVSNALETYLSSLRLRIDSLKEEQITLEEKKQKTVDQQQKAVLVARETALSQQEKDQYWGFLQKEYFTKADFRTLESFYDKTWDKLSEDGKAQMSHRVWEGVRREEYRFSELPETVKEKEAQRLRDALGAGNRDLEVIPETDRSDFINSWDAGRKKESYQVLDRPSFTKSVALSADAVVDTAATAQVTNKDAVVEAAQKEEKADAQPAKDRMGKLDVNMDDLAGVSLASADVQAPLSNQKKSGGAPTRSL